MGFCTQVVEKRRMKHGAIVGEGKCVLETCLQRELNVQMDGWMERWREGLSYQPTVRYGWIDG